MPPGQNESAPPASFLTRTPVRFGDSATDMTLEVTMARMLDHHPVPLHTTEGLPAEIAEFVGPWFNNMNREIVEKRKTHEQLFVELDVQPGDRVRLTEATRPIDTCRPVAKIDGATLEGTVRRVKRGKDGKWKIQINGFAVSGNNVFWPIGDYQVEVLHRAYRWTPLDRVTAELAGIQEGAWEKASEEYREVTRHRYGARARKIQQVLGVQS